MDKVVEAALDTLARTVSLASPSSDSPTFRVEEGDELRWRITPEPAGGTRVRIEFLTFPQPNDPEPLLVDGNLEAGAGETLGGRVNPYSHRGKYTYRFRLVSAGQQPAELRAVHGDGSTSPTVVGLRDPKP